MSPATECECGKTLKGNGIYNHYKLPHFRCHGCNAVFFGQAWQRHVDETAHGGVSMQPGLGQCAMDCGQTCSTARLEKHHQEAHYRCIACPQPRTFVLGGKNAHERETHHRCYLLNGDEAITGPNIFVVLTASLDAKTKTAHLQHLLDLAANPMLANFLDEMAACKSEMEASKHPGLRQSYWEGKLDMCPKSFPSGRLPRTKVGVWSCDGAAMGDMDVLFATGSQLRCSEGWRPMTLPRMVVVCSETTRPGALDRFAETMRDRHGGTDIDVQDASAPSHTPSASVMSCSAVIQRIKSPSRKLDNERPPLNCLNLRGDLVAARQMPEFITHPRYDLIPTIARRIDAWASPGRPTAGKQTRGPAPGGASATDLDSCTGFTLYSERGSYTGFHADILNGTWVTSLHGVKAWIFTAEAELAGAAMRQFAEHGAIWTPGAEDLRAVVLGPGMTLAMMPGHVVVHAVATLQNSLMVGGMFWEQARMMDILKNIAWIMENGNVTNESLPLQLINGWEVLKARLLVPDESVKDRYGPVTRADLDEVEARLKRVLQCDCASHADCARRKCGCFQSVNEYDCTSWCKCSEAQAQAQAQGKGRKRKR